MEIPFLRLITLASMLLGLITPVRADSLTLWNRNFDTAPVDKIVQLALDKTPESGSVTIVRSEPLEQKAAIKALQKNQLIDVLSAASSKANDLKLRAIRFPVL